MISRSILDFPDHARYANHVVYVPFHSTLYKYTYVYSLSLYLSLLKTLHAIHVITYLLIQDSASPQSPPLPDWSY
jgi:hypothetical protein